MHLSQENFTALDSSRSHAIRLEEEIEYLNVQIAKLSRALKDLNEDLTIIKKAIEYIENNNKIDEKISINPENNGNPTN